MMELTKAMSQPDCDKERQFTLQGKWAETSGSSMFRRGVSYNADSQRRQRERIAEDVSHAELLAPAISAVVVVHLLL